MSDPYAAKGMPTTTVTDKAHPIDHLCRRLALCGATDDELADFRAAAEEDPELVKRVRLWSDRRIKAELLEIREEHELHTHTEEEQETVDHDRLLDMATAAALDIIDRNVDAVKEWIGDDKYHAYAVRNIERDAAKPRKGVLDAASRVIDA